MLASINASPVVNVDIGASQSLMIHPPGHVAPDSDYTSSAIAYGTHPTMTTPPQPLFTYSATTPPGGTAISSVNVNFSGSSNVTWKWNKATDTFLRFYNGTTPDMLADNVQNQAANVVVQYVQISYGPWLENDEGGREVQADLYPNASGAAVIYRNGYAIPGTWHRTTLGSPTQFVNAFGVPIPMQPGQTWVELVPNTIMATTTPYRRVSSGQGLPRHHRQQEAVLRGREDAREPAGLDLVEHSCLRPRRMRLRPLHSVTSNPARSNLFASSPAAYSIWWSWFISSSERKRHAGPFGVSRQNQPPGARTAERLGRHRVPLCSLTCSMDWPL